MMALTESLEFDDVEEVGKPNNNKALSRVVKESSNCRICKNIIENGKRFLEQKSIKVSFRSTLIALLLIDLL